MPPKLNDTHEGVAYMRERMSEVDSKTRELTPLENEMLDLMCKAVAQGEQDCCYAHEVTKNQMWPLIKQYRPGVDLERFER